MSEYLDTRDLYKRQQELTDLKSNLEAAQEQVTEAETELADHGSQGDPEDREAFDAKTEELETAVSDAQTALDDAGEEFGDDEQTELAELDDLENEIGREWRHGETMIPENDFEDYARQLADELGLIPDENRWPCTYIDWEQAAKELAMDYATITYQGEDYYVRA
jgi:antirestriction protein